MLTVAVTGAGGYIGKHVIAELKGMGAKVIGVDVRPSDSAIVDEWKVLDLFDSQIDFRDEFSTIPDVCLHLAWRNGFDHRAASHMSDLSSHYRFLLNMADLGVPQIAVMGSMHEIGYWEGPIDENTPCSPQSLYGIAKDALRRSLLIEAGRKGFTLQWLRGFYIYGDDASSESIFGKLLRADRQGQTTFPFTTGKNKFDFTRIDQLASMISASVMQNEIKGIINCCSGIPVSLADQVESYIQENRLNISLDYGAFPDRPYDSPAVWGDSSKIESIIHRFRSI